MVCSAWLGCGALFAQAASDKAVSALDPEESAINYLIKDKERLDVGSYKEMRTPLLVYKDQIKFIGDSREGRFFTAGLLPASSKYWVTFHSLDLTKIKARMKLGELIDLLAHVDGPDPWLLIAGSPEKNALESNSIVNIQLASEERGFLQFIRIRATIQLEKDLDASRVFIQGVGVVRLNPLGFANLSPYGMDF